MSWWTGLAISGHIQGPHGTCLQDPGLPTFPTFGAVKNKGHPGLEVLYRVKARP